MKTKLFKIQIEARYLTEENASEFTERMQIQEVVANHLALSPRVFLEGNIIVKEETK